jgi:large repetitive protein
MSVVVGPNIMAAIRDMGSGTNHQKVKGPAANALSPASFTPIPVGEVLGGGIVAVAYSETLTAQGGTPAYTFSLNSGSLPPGLSLTGATGVITGTPTTVGVYVFTIQVLDSLGYTGTQTFSIAIVAPSSVGAANYGYIV